jgi:hypothetical protein
MQKYISLLVLLFFFPTMALAETPFVVYKSGKTFKPKEDLHCLNNENSIKLINKVKLCEKECQVLLQEAKRLHKVEVGSLNSRILNQKISYQKIILQQEKMIFEIKESIIEELDENSSEWWKITLAVVGGVLVGTASTAAVISLTK